ncbi:FAD-dependent oxidoreductase [Kineosporia babensis]|uniref:FAD-dependent monooxygenase n=1 Tax=Kineosporia babensis TaxID=499548 RepID=A0A9X1NIZ2_9ACTN|nr:FAD-dependent oxidoreductase [Kineosporia babensis]MCD5313968.1 FAD-dependent monooxygenase [Kineosporia babensis]
MNPSPTVETDVVVVGAGPVGMVAALSLARNGVPVVVLEAGKELSAESRASTFHPPTLEILHGLGVGAELHAKGLIARNFQYRDRHGNVLADLDLGLLADDTAFPYRLQCEQNKLTEIVAAHLEQLPTASLRFGAEVQRVERGSENVSVYLPGDGREPSYRAKWVIATDGASSTVRKSLGVAFEGVTLPERFLVASTTFDLTEAFPGLALVSYVSDPQEWGVLLRTPKHWRVLMPVAEGTTDEQALAPETIEARLQQLSARPEPYPLDHASIYAVHQRVAATFAAGRVLIAGDAAHANNPLGGMGMNSGIHDAEAAVRVILAALSGADPDACAAAYDHARRSATISHVQATTKKNYADMRESDTEARHQRTAALGAMAADPVKARAYLLNSSMIRSLAESREQLATGLRAARTTAQAPGRQLADLLTAKPLIAPGCHDAVSARLLQQAGFTAGYLSGAGVSATVLGSPDSGFAGVAEMTEQIRRIAAAGVPVIADADGGYGGPLQVARTVREYELAGAAAIQLEDQVHPKSKTALIPLPDMVEKIRSAVAARQQMLVIARTDALGVDGLETALERAQAYAEAGADLLMVQHLSEPKLLTHLNRSTGKRLVLNLSEAHGEITAPDLDLLGDCGVAVVIYPVSGLLAASGAIRDTYAAIATTHVPHSTESQMSWADLTGLLENRRTA